MKALITGITGQDGSYLAEFLLARGYEVHGLIRRSSTFNTERIDHLYVDPHEEKARLFLHYGDMTDSGQLTHLIYNLQPDEIYHLAAQSHVRVSFEMPSSPETSPALERPVSWKPSAGAASGPGSTKPPAARCSAIHHRPE